MQHNETGSYPHIRQPPAAGGPVNPSQLSGLTSPAVPRHNQHHHHNNPHLQQQQHGPQQQLRHPQVGQPNQFAMRPQQQEKLQHPFANNSQVQQQQQQQYFREQQQHFHQQQQQQQQERQHLFKNFANSPQQQQQQQQQRANTIGPSFSNNHLNNNADPLTSTTTTPNSKSQTLSSPTRRLDISSSPNSSPHSTMESKKGRSRSLSTSTPGKSGLAIKRSDDAPVTLQGWLYKQGSDGLMLWKKRWFVLSEFCLFYYKGPDEDRCSGSILLPSYKISPVSKEDGVYRKFSFKAEHQNMRTYFFAAENKESMSQWMNALSLASICQQEQNFHLNRSPSTTLPIVLSPAGHPTRFSPRQNNNNSNNNSAIPNYPTTTIVQHHYPPAVHQMFSPNGNAYQYQPSTSSNHRHSVRLDSSEADDENGGSRQPLYANAPPKPKRLNTSRDRESPSPERLVYQVNEDPVPLVTAMYQQPHSGVHRAHVIDENTPQSYRHRLPQERRTPEVYGRAAFFNNRQQPPPQQQQQQQQQQQPLRQYEDMYNANNRGQMEVPMPADNFSEFQQQQQQQQHQHQQQQQFVPQPPVGYPSHPQLNNSRYFDQRQTLPNNRHIQQHYQDQQQQQQQQQQLPMTREQLILMRQGRPASSRERVPRPHSADFLEYERQFGQTNLETEMGQEPSSQSGVPQRGQAAHHPNRRHHHQQPPRPKSSIEQRIPSELRRQMIEQQNIEDGHVQQRLSSTTPTPRGNNNFAYAQQQLQQLQLENRGGVMNSNNNVNNNFVANNQRTAATTTPRQPETSTPNHYRDRMQKIQYNDPQNTILDATSEEIQRYFPTPSPRKNVANVATTLNPPSTTYMNVPVVGNRVGPPMHRLESVTPNRLVSDYAEEQHRINMADEAATGGEFRRSSSARLHRNKRNHSEIFEHLHFGHEENKRKEQREESMKRLLEWKQRMLQSPLTRKSSRNASRTQTPTNSSSPVPSLNNNNSSSNHNNSSDFFRQKVMMELERSGESSVKSSQTPSESRRVSRKGSGASRSSRNRSSPRISNRPGGNTSSSDEDGANSSDNRRPRKRSKSRQSLKSAEKERSTTSAASEFEASPDYMNIQRLSGDGREEPLEKVVVDNEVVWRRKAIGPDDRYNDDFSYGQSTFFHEDPLLHQQYGRLLDMRYRVQKEHQNLQHQQQQPQQQQQQQERKSPTRRPMRREKTWHGDKFQDFQILEKGNNEKVLLTVQRTASSVTQPSFSGTLSSDKIPWSPVKAFEEIRKVKEAPPKNVVQHRLKQFEKSDDLREELKNAVMSEQSKLLETNAERRERFMRGDDSDSTKMSIRTLDNAALQRKMTEKVREFALKSEEVVVVKERVEELAERESRNFRDLLSDFEKKSRELKKKEEEEHRGASNYLLCDNRTERRVFSDTETMMYDTSSDDDSSDNKKSKPTLPPPLPSSKKASNPAPPLPKKSVSSIDSEDKYIPMTPPVSLDRNKVASESTYLTMTPPKVNKKLKSAFSTSSPRASITTSSTSGSIRSLHSRTPSQTLVMEHLQREFCDGSRMITEEASYVDMTEKARREGTLFESRRSESPRYCEIDESAHTTLNEEEGSLSSAPSHYEYLYQARTASSQHYESVYQEIPEEDDVVRPMDRLPDILGNTPPVDVQCAISSDLDDPRETPTAKMMMYASDTFRPASFFLDHSSQNKKSSSSSSSRERELPTTPKSSKANKNRSSREEVRMSPRRRSEGSTTDVQKQGRSSSGSGLPPDKINLTYRSVYENETSSYSDSTDPKNSAASAASTASLNRDTDGSGGAAYYVSELSSPHRANSLISDHGIEVRPDSVRSRTPDFFLDSDRDPGVARSKSLEGLLGDGHASARDSVRVLVTPSIVRNISTQPVSAPSPTSSSYRSTPLPARGREPPPPPPCPPMSAADDLLPPWRDEEDDEERWRQSLRRASAEHKARSSPFVRRSVAHNEPFQQQQHHLERRSYSVCADPVVDSNTFMTQQNFLESGLPEGIPPASLPVGSHSGRPLLFHPSTDQPLPYISMPNISSASMPSTPAPPTPSGRRSVAASFAPDHNIIHSVAHNTNSMARSDLFLPQAEAQHQTPAPVLEDLSEASRDSRHRRRNNSSSSGLSKKDSSANSFKPQKVRGNLLDLTAQDLLGKSHEELVLMLIHLRRQSTALNEAIDASKSELQNLANRRMNSLSDNESGDSSGEHHRRLMGDLRGHIKDLEEKRARGLPIISLVDNMVKLGSLYRGPEDAPLSHRVRNIPVEQIQQRSTMTSHDLHQQHQQQLHQQQQLHVSTKRKADIQDLLERSLHYVNKQMSNDGEETKAESEELIRQQQNLVRELEKVRSQLQSSQMKLDDVASQQSHWEHDILLLRQQLQTSASRDMQYGLGQSAETLNIESELAHVHQQATELHRRRTLLSREIEALTQKQDFLTNEIRPSPTGVAGADAVPSRKKKWTTGWLETDLDSMVSIDRAGEVETQLKKESGLKKSSLKGSQNVYVNTYEEEEHGYENFDRNAVTSGNGHYNNNNPYEDDVQTVHSEGVRSEMDPPPIPSGKRPTNGMMMADINDSTTLTLGDISEADDRVKKFYGILPRDTIKEIKTVRMVKRDSKERSVSKTGSNLEEDDEDDEDEGVEESYVGEEPPPPPLPRGNYQNLHDFLKTPNDGSQQQQQNFGSLPRTTSGRIRYTDPDDDDDAGEDPRNGSASNGLNGKTSSTLPKTNFKLGEYYKRKYSKDSEKSGNNGVSAHERLFGSSRETSMSPPSSPDKSFSASSRVSSTASPITSPIFKSATAKAIIEEVGKTTSGPALQSQKRRNKKRSLTITSSHPAVMEAINDHQARMLQGSARSRDDLDMEQALRPRGQNTPDVIRSALDKNDSGLATIDNLFGAPDKIVIPERYIPDTDMDNQTPEERKVRLKKVDSIRRMLAAGQSAAGINRPSGESSIDAGESLTEERKQREQLLELNHLIARQVMEKSRMVAGKSQQS